MGILDLDVGGLFLPYQVMYAPLMETTRRVCYFSDSERVMAPHSMEAHADPGVGPAGDRFRAMRLHWALQYRGCYHLVLAVFSLRWGPHGSPCFWSSVMKPVEGPAMVWGWRSLQERSVRKNISGRKIKAVHLRPLLLHEIPETGKYGGMIHGVTIHFMVQRVVFVGVPEGLFAVLSGQQWVGSFLTHLSGQKVL